MTAVTTTLAMTASAVEETCLVTCPETTTDATVAVTQEGVRLEVAPVDTTIERGVMIIEVEMVLRAVAVAAAVVAAAAVVVVTNS